MWAMEDGITSANAPALQNKHVLPQRFIGRDMSSSVTPDPLLDVEQDPHSIDSSKKYFLVRFGCSDSTP
jgi:hypothetical protein